MVSDLMSAPRDERTTRPRRPVATVAMASLMTLSLALAPAARAQMPGVPENMGNMKEMRWGKALFVLLDELEYAPGNALRPVNLDGRMWYGGAYERFWVRAEGEQTTALGDNVGEGEAQVLYGRLIDPFWDAVIGVRVDRSWGHESDGRVHLAVGLLGLAPYRFELEPTIFVSSEGHVSARLEAEFPVLITQRLIAEPGFEVNAALQGVPRFGVRSGLNDYELGLRVRYEIIREIAPYVGWSRTRRFGDGGAADEDALSDNQLVVGVRLWR